jgi:hypothetical protein
MEPQEIWGLILKADDVVKYAKPGREAEASEKAGRLLAQARGEAVLAGNASLVEQASVRLRDLGLGEGEPDA